MAVAERESNKRLSAESGIGWASLYDRLKMPTTDEGLRRQIEAMMLENPGCGSPRVATALGMIEKRAAPVMRKSGLKLVRRPKPPRKPDDIGR